jgi:pimeloyl-ACP methyl ester carboxylesterase
MGGRREYSLPIEDRNARASGGLATLEVGGIEIPWCGDPGSGTPVVMLAGLGWRATGSVLSGHAGENPPIVALDYPRRWPRRPLDRVEDLAQLYGAAVEALGLRRVRLLGVSLGGMAALQLALDDPDRIESLALVSTAPAGARVSGRWRVPLSRAVAGALPSEIFFHLYRRWGPRLVGAAPFGTPGEVARLWADPMGRRKMGDLLRATARFDARERLGELRCRTLILHGRGDLVFGPEAAAELARGIPEAQAVLLEGADHFAFLTHRSRVFRELDCFWNRS